MNYGNAWRCLGRNKGARLMFHAHFECTEEYTAPVLRINAGHAHSHAEEKRKLKSRLEQIREETVAKFIIWLPMIFHVAMESLTCDENFIRDSFQSVRSFFHWSML